MNKPLVLLDCGNSAIKWIRIDEGRDVVRGRSTLSSLAADLGSGLSGSAVLVSSVASTEAERDLKKTLEALGCNLWFAQSVVESDGLRNAYAEPGRLGVDRWLAMLGARQRSQGDFCVVDAGSALTVDLVSAAGEHLGGYIIPGLSLMERALFNDTERVRFEGPRGNELQPGRSTAEAVGHGLMLAHCGAIEKALDQFARCLAVAPAVFLCGGDAPTLQPVLDHPVTVAPDLIFEGLLVQARSENVHAAMNFSASIFTVESY